MSRTTQPKTGRGWQAQLGLWALWLPVVGLGCLPLPPAAGVEKQAEPPPVAQAADEKEKPPAEPEPLPTPHVLEEGKETTRIVPISLDTVLRLAEEQNPQIGIARLKVEQACAEREVAAYRWLPDLWVGAAYYRHENGIQDFPGTLIDSSTQALYTGPELAGRFDIKEIAFQQVNAERSAWQQKGELAKITSETLLDAAGTYLDLMAARTGEAVARLLEKDTLELLERTKKLAEVEPGLRVELARIYTDINSRKQTIIRLASQARAASAKLVYLLGLDPCVELVPVDERLVPIDLVDAEVEACELVARSLVNGPGMRELEGLVALVHDSMEKANSPLKYMPTIEFKALEGGFGAAPGSGLAWDNRFDLGLQVRWNLTELAAIKQRRRITLAAVQQLHLTYDDLRRKLTVGVKETHASIHSNREQIGLSEQQIEHSTEAYRLSRERFHKGLERATPSEVLLSIQARALAQLNYISAIREYDRNQLQLMILLGPGACGPVIQESGVRSQETGVRNQESGVNQ